MRNRANRGRLLVIAYHFPPSVSVATFRLLRFLRHLSDCGWDVDVLTARKERYAVRDPSLDAAIPRCVRVFRESASEALPSTSPPENRSASITVPRRLAPAGLLKRVVRSARAWFPDAGGPMHWNRVIVQAGMDLVLRERYDCIYSTSGPLACHAVAATLARAGAIPWVAEFRDALSDNPYHISPTRWHRLRRLVSEERVVRAASCVVVTTRAHADLLEQRYGPGLGIMVVPNGYDPSEYGPAPSHAGRFVLVHAGNLYGSRSLEPLLLGWKEWIAGLPPGVEMPVLRFYGESFNLEIGKFLTRNGLAGTVEAMGVRTHGEVMGALRGAGASVVIKSPQDRVHIPGKLYESLGSGRPVLLLGPESEASRLVEGLGAGVWVSSSEPAAIAEGLRRISVQAGGSLEPPEEFRADRLARVLAAAFDSASGRAIERALPLPCESALSGANLHAH